MEKLVIIGEKGENGKKIKRQLSKNYNIIGIDIDNICELSNDETISLDKFLITSPPSSHNIYIEYISSKNPNALILCEKPIIDIICLKAIGNVRIIDHYLYKKNIKNIKKYFDKQSNRIEKITLAMCESNKENRNWMTTNRYEGGVTLDMGHHMIAILGLLIGYKNLNKIYSLSLHSKHFFQNCLLCTDMHVRFSCFYNNIEIIIEYGKEIFESKKVIFYLPDKTETHFDLNDSVNYENILFSPSLTLSMENVKDINNFIYTILRKVYENSTA